MAWRKNSGKAGRETKSAQSRRAATADPQAVFRRFVRMLARLHAQAAETSVKPQDRR
ncbi:MAG: hypothetical protein AB7F96_02750 [Beijerinckiaceae bacterium]